MQRLWQRKMSYLDAPGVFIGVDHAPSHRNPEYDWLRPKKAKLVPVKNPGGSVGWARELIRRACQPERYDLVIQTDDNATYTREALDNLVCAWYAYQKWSGQTVIMAGMHGTAAHWDKDKVEGAEVVGGLRSYPRISMMLWGVPGDLYADYEHPKDVYCYEDRHLVMWMIQQGIRQFRVCPDAPFAKARYEPGGQGLIADRISKNTMSTQALCRDFPIYMGLSDPMTPWSTILKYEDGGIKTRLGGRNAR
jgi:hypothetical protein